MASRLKELYQEVLSILNRPSNPQSFVNFGLMVNGFGCLEKQNGNWTLHYYRYPLCDGSPSFSYGTVGTIKTKLSREQEIDVFEAVLTKLYDTYGKLSFVDMPPHWFGVTLDSPFSKDGETDLCTLGEIGNVAMSIGTSVIHHMTIFNNRVRPTGRLGKFSGMDVMFKVSDYDGVTVIFTFPEEDGKQLAIEVGPRAVNMLTGENVYSYNYTNILNSLLIVRDQIVSTYPITAPL